MLSADEIQLAYQTGAHAAKRGEARTAPALLTDAAAYWLQGWDDAHAAQNSAQGIRLFLAPDDLDGAIIASLPKPR